MNHPLPSKCGLLPRSWAALYLLVMPLLANAQNLIVNGTFDQNVVDWGNVAVWDGTHDAANNPNSGSDEVSVVYDGATTCTNSTQCVPVTAGQSYGLSAQILILTGEASIEDPNEGYANLTVLWTSSPTCASAQVTGSFTTNQIGTNQLGGWHGVNASAQTAPPGTVSALVLPTACASSGAISANFDNIVLEATSTTSSVATASATGTIALTLCTLLMLVAVGIHLGRMPRQQAEIRK